MSEFTEQMDSDNMICPYCDVRYQVECEDYTEYPEVAYCGACGMKYHRHQSFSVDHHSEPDCELNNLEHKWETLKLSNGEHDFCSVCDMIRPRANPDPSKPKSGG